jgi:ferredoxin-NADP reductase
VAEKKTGRAATFERLTPVLARFRLRPEDGSPFPEYRAGQYIALSRPDCKLTRRVPGTDGKPCYLPDLDESGQPRRGTVTHSYSIASAPWETRERGHLEFYIVLEVGEQEYPGRLTESFFRMEPGADDQVGYVNRIAGDFTLDKRAAGARNVVMVGTGTGLAPFAGMVKELDHQARTGGVDPGVRYTLFHANRTSEELAYHRELMAIEDAARFDFCYVATVSRPTAADRDDERIGTGRANNVLRHVLGLPEREEEEVAEAEKEGRDAAAARRALERAVRPALPRRASRSVLRDRLDPASAVILTCGNPSAMADIKRAADRASIRFEKEDWKVVLPSRA